MRDTSSPKTEIIPLQDNSRPKPDKAASEASKQTKAVQKQGKTKGTMLDAFVIRPIAEPKPEPEADPAHAPAADTDVVMDEDGAMTIDAP